jgi:hypothetical protein
VSGKLAYDIEVGSLFQQPGYKRAAQVMGRKGLICAVSCSWRSIPASPAVVSG